MKDDRTNLEVACDYALIAILPSRLRHAVERAIALGGTVKDVMLSARQSKWAKARPLLLLAVEACAEEAVRNRPVA